MSSDRALTYFPQNKSYNCETHLNAPLLLGGVWKVALVDVDIVSSTSKTEAIYLYSSICWEYIVEGEKKPLLRRLPASHHHGKLVHQHRSTILCTCKI